MKRIAALLLFTTSILAQQADVRQRVLTDALVLDRLAEVANKRELPSGLLKRVFNDDIELMRGRRSDGTYQYATWERFEAARIQNGFSVQASGDKLESIELKGAFVYRLLIEVPARKMLMVRKNRPVWIERVDIELMAVGTTQTQTQSLEVKAWMQPGEMRPFDLPAIARQATARVSAKVEEKGGYANVSLTLVQARIIDNADSPYAEAVTGSKAVLRALDNSELPSLRAMAQRIRDSLGGMPVPAATAMAAPVPAPAAIVTTPAQVTTADRATRLELQAELQLIEDLLTGTEVERREGMDRLHQLIRKMR